MQQGCPGQPMCGVVSEESIRGSSAGLHASRSWGELPRVGERHPCSMPEIVQMRTALQVVQKWGGVIRAVWVTLAVVVLLATSFGLESTPNRDNELFMAIAMIGLSFPSSYLLILALTGLNIL